MFGKVFRIKSTASLGKHVAVEGILNIDTTLGGYLYLDGSLMSGTEIAYLDGVTAGTALASKAVVLGASKEIATITSATITTLTTNGIIVGAGTTGISIAGATTTGLSVTGASATPIAISNTFSGNGIDFSGCTYVPTGSGGPCLIRAGSYDVPLTNSATAQSGLIRLYMETSADGSSYDRAIFTCLKTTGTKGIIPVSGLAEVHEDATGPTNVMGCQFITQLFDTGSHLAANAQMFGGWFKVTAIDGSTIASTATVAPLWIDNQLYGANATGSHEYGLYCTTGGSRPVAFMGFNTTSSGYDNFIYFDSTYASNTMLISGDIDAYTATYYLRCNVNGTGYGIQLYALS